MARVRRWEAENPERAREQHIKATQKYKEANKDELENRRYAARHGVTVEEAARFRAEFWTKRQKDERSEEQENRRYAKRKGISEEEARVRRAEYWATRKPKQQGDNRQ